MDAEIRRYVEEDELTSWTVMIHGALYIYRWLFWTKEELDARVSGGNRGIDPQRRRRGDD
jgi:hypothetical protein